MKDKTFFPKVALNLYVMQLLWSLIFLGIILLIQIVRPLLEMVPFMLMNDQFKVQNYFDTVFVSSNIFMLVIGIIVITALLPYYINNGVTRKNYFKGATIAAAGLSISIPVISSVIYALQHVIMKLTDLPFVPKSNLVNEMTAGIGEDIISDFIQSIIFTPFVELETNWLLAITVFALNLFTYYVVGWLIGAGFYRFGVLVGLMSIGIGVIVISIQNLLLSIALELPVHDVFASLDIPLSLAILGTLIVLGITVWMIRQMTKRVAIKL